MKKLPIVAFIILALSGLFGAASFLGANEHPNTIPIDESAVQAFATAVAANDAAVQAFATAVAANDAAVQAFATAVAPTPTVEPTVEPTATHDGSPTPTPTPSPTNTPAPTPTPTATPTAEEIELAAPVAVPVAMVGAWWNWRNTTALNEITIDIEIHNDIELVGDNGLYLFGCQGGGTGIGGTGYYFGLQTDVFDPTTSGRGKGLIFSRWGTRSLTHARIPDEGWTQSSGHEGDFIGVRRGYEWGEGQYRVQLRKDGDDDAVGRWYGLWITDLSTNNETWIGSLRFPHTNGIPPLIGPECYNTVEVYGFKPIAPKDIPHWKVTLRPMGDGVPATLTTITSSGMEDDLFRNSNASINEHGAIIYEVGLNHIPEDRPES